jgi:hypothetical protein
MSLSSEEKLRRLEKALEHGGGTHTVDDVMERVRENRAACWPNGDSLVVTEVLVFPRLRAVNYWIASGNLQECLALAPAIDAWGIEQGCTVAMATGRMGWLKVAGKMPLAAGWRPVGVKFAKGLRL